MPAPEPVFAVISSPVPGHLYPMSAVARALSAKGARVLYFTIPDAALFLQGQEIETVVFGKSVFPEGSWGSRWGKVSRSVGARAALATIGIHRDLAKVGCAELPDLFRRYGVTHLIADQNQYHGHAVARGCGIPFLNVTCTVPLNRDEIGEVPPVSEEWTPPRGPLNSWLRLRNRLAFRCVDFFMRSVLAPEKNLLGGRSRSRLQDGFASLTLTGLPAALNWPALHPQLTYVGHLIGSRPETREFPWNRIELEKPLVYVSFGTISTELDAVISEIVLALEGMDVEFLISRGKWRAAEFAMEKIANGWIASYVPQLEALGRAAVFINHAGINSVVESISLGVPVLLFPVTNDQPGMAARSVEAGVGLSLPRRRWRASFIRESVREILTNPLYRKNAVRIGQEIKSAGGPDRAAEMILDWSREV